MSEVTAECCAMARREISWMRADNFAGPDETGWAIGLGHETWSNIAFCPWCGTRLEDPEREPMTGVALEVVDPRLLSWAKGLVREIYEIAPGVTMPPWWNVGHKKEYDT